jgi:HEAT repeat protein
MTRALTMTLVVVAGVVAAAQQPQIQNGRVETRQASSISGEIATLGAGSADPIWVAWREPVVDGRRAGCSWYSDDSFPNGIRGMVIESDNGPYKPPQITAPTGPVPLEAGTNVVVLARITNKRVERLRTFGDDCPLDANGRTVYWLNGITPAESLKFLEGLTHPDYATMVRSGADNLVSGAMSAIAYHRDPAADAILDRLAADPDSTVRRQAISQLGNNRGAHGFETLRRLLDSERAPDVRRSVVSALVQTRQPQTVEVLLAIARSDSDESIRADAVYYLPARGGDRMIPDVLKILASDGSTNVRQRAISGIGTLPGDAGVPTLIQLAKDSRDVVVRKQAVTVLGRSKDPRAIAFLQELLK